jgi:hypothetical protein
MKVHQFKTGLPHHPPLQKLLLPLLTYPIEYRS